MGWNCLLLDSSDAFLQPPYMPMTSELHPLAQLECRANRYADGARKDDRTKAAAEVPGGENLSSARSGRGGEGVEAVIHV